MVQLCRVCLATTSEPIDLTEYCEGLPLSVIVMIILPIKIYDGEDFNLPQQICKMCMETVVAAYKLRDVSLKSEKLLKSNDDVHVKSEILNDGIIMMDNAEYKVQAIIEKREDYDQTFESDTETNIKSPIICEFCEMKFSTGDELDIHISEEHFSTPNQEISEEFIEGFHIDFYKKDRTSKTSMVWRFYGKLMDEYNEHIQTEYHFCNICLSRKILTKYKKTTATSTLFFHLNTVHGIGKNGSGSNINYVKEKYTQRKQRVSTTGPAVTATVCSDCGKSFGNHHILKKHMKIHSGLFYPCDSCPAKFSYVENLYRHQRCHDPNHLSRYICDMCGNRFAEMKSIKSHINRVHLKIPQQRKFSCNFDGCNLKFCTGFSLKKHLMTHTDLKPHECKFCDNAYTSKGDLIKHLHKNHLGDAIYNCEHCNESFRFKVQLRDHYKVHYRRESTNS